MAAEILRIVPAFSGRQRVAYDALGVNEFRAHLYQDSHYDTEVGYVEDDWQVELSLGQGRKLKVDLEGTREVPTRLIFKRVSSVYEQFLFSPSVLDDARITKILQSSDLVAALG